MAASPFQRLPGRAGGGGGGGGCGLVFRAVVSLAFECLGLKGLLNVEVPCAFVDNPEILSSGV